MHTTNWWTPARRTNQLRDALYRIERTLDRIEQTIAHSPGGPDNGAALRQLLEGQTKIMADLSGLTASVAAERTVVDSAVALLGQLAQLIRDAGVDPAALADLAASIDAQASDLGAAVSANTPGA